MRPRAAPPGGSIWEEPHAGGSAPGLSTTAHNSSPALQWHCPHLATRGPGLRRQSIDCPLFGNSNGMPAARRSPQLTAGWRAGDRVSASPIASGAGDIESPSVVAPIYLVGAPGPPKLSRCRNPMPGFGLVVSVTGIGTPRWARCAVTPPLGQGPHCPHEGSLIPNSEYNACRELYSLRPRHGCDTQWLMGQSTTIRCGASPVGDTWPTETAPASPNPPALKPRDERFIALRRA